MTNAKIVTQISLLALGLALAGCGGGGGAVGSTPPPPPTPTPTPPPPPPPPPPNTSLLNLTSSESFTNDAATATANFPKTGVGQTASAAPSTATIAYDLATRGYTITVAGRSQTFLPADIDNAQSNAGVTVYVRRNGTTTDSLTLTKPGTSGRFTYEYVGGGYWQRTIDGATAISGSFDAFSYGVRTPDAAVPRSGLGRYGLDLIGVEVVANNVIGITGTGTMQVDFGNGTVISHGRLDTSAPTPIGALPQGYFSSEARLSSSANSFAGNFRYYGFGEYTGQLNGRFYGPAAQEVGAAFHATEPGGFLVTGTLIGRKANLPAANTTMTALTSDAFFANDAATLTTTLQGTSGTNNATETFSNSSASAAPLVINYDADQKAYTLIAGTRSQYFISQSRDRGTTTERLEERFTNLIGPTQYVSGQRWFTRVAAGANSTGYTLTDTVFGLTTPNASLLRSGKAGYNFALTGSAADADLPNLTNFGAKGVLTADFATGAITATGPLSYAEDYFIAGRAPRSGIGTFSLSSTISSTANSFAGTINLVGFGNYSGSLNGRFYGPDAEEIGAAFSATDGAGGAASGILTGIKDPNIFAVVPGLLDLTQTTLLTNFAIGGATSNNISTQSYLQYNPATKTYALFPALLPTTNAADLAYRFGPDQILTSQSNASYTAYQATGPAGQFNATDTFKASVFNPGPTNPQLVMTYTSFADFSVTNNSAPMPLTSTNLIVFGVPTPSAQAPRTGTATYSGLAFGKGSAGATALNFDGTSSFTANFGAATFNASVSLTARNPLNSDNFVLAPLTFSGSIFNGLQISGSGVNDFSGTFFGPNAAEFGAAFSKNGTDVVLGNFSVLGVAFGKKN
jgi:hypothetical protein